MTKYQKNVDWTIDQERYDFEEEIRMWKARRKDWTWCQTLVWILEIFVLNFLVILALYGGKLQGGGIKPRSKLKKLISPTIKQKIPLILVPIKSS